MKRKIHQKSLFNLHRFSVDITYDSITNHINIISVFHKKSNCQKKKEYDKLYYIKNRERLLYNRKKYQKKHRDDVNKRHKIWRIKHPEKDKEYYLKTTRGKNELINKIKINGCAICGYNKCKEALSFHHVNPNDKKFNISCYTKSDGNLIDELNKCILLCRNCHMEIEMREKKYAIM